MNEGLQERGSWLDIVEHGERFTEALQDECAEAEKLNEWNEWRPRSEDSSEKQRRKTARNASIDTKDSSVKEAFEKSGPKKQYTLLRVGNYTSRRIVQAVEEIVYKKIMSVTSPQYFDNKLISAELKTLSEDTYVLSVTVNQREIQDTVYERIRNGTLQTE